MKFLRTFEEFVNEGIILLIYRDIRLGKIKIR